MTNKTEGHSWTSGRRRQAISRPLLGAMHFLPAAALWSQDTRAYTYNVVYAFGDPPDGLSPSGKLTRDKEGTFMALLAEEETQYLNSAAIRPVAAWCSN